MVWNVTSLLLSVAGLLVYPMAGAGRASLGLAIGLGFSICQQSILDYYTNPSLLFTILTTLVSVLICLNGLLVILLAATTYIQGMGNPPKLPSWLRNSPFLNYSSSPKTPISQKERKIAEQIDQNINDFQLPEDNLGCQCHETINQKINMVLNELQDLRNGNRNALGAEKVVWENINVLLDKLFLITCIIIFSMIITMTFI